MLSKLKMHIEKYLLTRTWLNGGSGSFQHFFTRLFFSAEAVEWYPCCFAIILLVYAPPKITSELVQFVIFGGLLLFYSYIRRLSQIFLATSVAYPAVFISLYPACYIMLTTNDFGAVDCWYEHYPLWHAILH